MTSLKLHKVCTSSLYTEGYASAQITGSNWIKLFVHISEATSECLGEMWNTHAAEYTVKYILFEFNPINSIRQVALAKAKFQFYLN